MILPAYEQSLEFLQWWTPEGPWVLTAIAPDRKGIETRTFRPEDDVLEWLTAQGDERNVYFHVNPVLRDLTKKGTREDVASMGWLHVDLDPRAGEDLNEERERALRLLREPPGQLPPPSCVVFSGGGYQGFWRLEEPVPINGDESLYEDAKRYNVQLEVLFGADNCHNVDRIMRLPGTVNRPDKKKREKGRVPVLAEVVELHDDRVYQISEFTQSPSIQKGDTGFSGDRRIVEVSGNIERVSGLDDAQLAQVPDDAKVVILQGFDPENPDRFRSRSEAIFYVCCAMVRAGCEDDLIYAVITDPDFSISSSVLDKGSSAERYAIRQIERAREEAVDPGLRELNERHAVISNWAGKCRVVEEVYDEVMGRHKLTRQSFEDFRNRYMNRYVELPTGDGKVVTQPLGKWWLSNPLRRQYDTVVFAPEKEVAGAYNLWRGFACDPKPGACDLFLEHVRQNLCGDDKKLFGYLMGWMATAVQDPARPGYAAIVLRGSQGTGKSFFAKTFGHLFGRHFMHVSDPKHLVGNFNAHLRDCVVLFGDEAFYAGDKKHESVLKMLVTEDLLVIEPKGVDAEITSNCVHLMMASNDDWVVPAGLDDRRFFVLDVSPAHKEHTEYFGEMQAQLEAGGYEALLHELMHYDVSNFDVRKVPKTAALRDQKMHSMEPIQEWWYDKLTMGQLMETHSAWRCEIVKQDLQNDFLRYARAFNLTRRGNATKLGRALSQFMPEGWPRTEQRSGRVEVRNLDGTVTEISRPYFYSFPTLKECREYWDKNFGGPYDWGPELPDSPDVPF